MRGLRLFVCHVRHFRSFRLVNFTYMYMKLWDVNFKAQTNAYIGRHNCLWCEVRSNELKIPLSIHDPSTQRSLQTLQVDYTGFVAAGGNIRQVKDHHNVIHPYFFEIPLNQV